MASPFLIVLFAFMASANAQADQCEIVQTGFHHNKVAEYSYPEEARGKIEQTPAGALVTTTKNPGAKSKLGALGDQAGNPVDSYITADVGPDEIQLKFYSPDYKQREYTLHGKYCVMLYKNEKEKLTRDLWAIYAVNPEGEFIKVRRNLPQNEYDDLTSGNSIFCSETSDQKINEILPDLQRGKFKICGSGPLTESVSMFYHALNQYTKDVWAHPVQYSKAPITSLMQSSKVGIYEVANFYYRQSDACWTEAKKVIIAQACQGKRESNNMNFETSGLESQKPAKEPARVIKADPYADQDHADQEKLEHPLLRANDTGSAKP